MLIEISYWSTEKYLPTKRHRKLRECRVQRSCPVEIKELAESEFPVAFIVHDYKSVYKDAKSYFDFNGTGDYQMFAEEIRTYGGKLYQPVRITHGAAISLHFETLDYIKREIEGKKPYWIGGEGFTANSIVKEDDTEDCRKSIQAKAGRYTIFDGKVWELCGEPMYVINTFGLGHNHGGTAFFIVNCYNPNISSKNYFNALEREQAVAYGKKIAANRGDTKSIEGIGKHCWIEVLMPEMAHRNPQKDHGEGDPFMNSLESLISNSDSVVEAGFLCIAKTISDLKK